VGFLSRGIPDGLVTLFRLWLVVLRDLPRYVVNEGAPVNFRGALKHAFVKALLDDLPDGRLWESTRVDFLRLKLGIWSPLYQNRLHSDLDEAVV
jgi:hypothetical protein